MDTAAPTSTPTSPAAPEPFWQRRAVNTTLRVLAVVAGVAGAWVAFVLTVLIAHVNDCSGDATGLCTNFAAVVPALEWAIVIIATGAPLAGGIASYRRDAWPWLPAGLLTGAAMVWLIVIVSSGQTSTMLDGLS